MMRQILAFLVLSPLFTAVAYAQNPASEVESLITETSLETTIRFLSDDLLEGRGVGTRGDRLSRLFIRTQLELFGLAPGAKDGAWEQKVPIVGITAKIQKPLSARNNAGEEITFHGPRDFVVNAGSPSPRSEWKDAELVFVGYGISAPEQKWDDFKGADLKGKVLLVMNNDPSSDPKLFAGRTRLYYGRWSYKFEEAARRGAVGAIVIHTTPSAGYPFQVIQAGYGKEDFHLPFNSSQPTLALDAWCSEDAARQMVRLGGKDLDALRSAAEGRDFKPVPLGVTVACATENKVRNLNSANVLGLLPGSDPSLNDTAVIVTAHFDHLGIGQARKGDTIYNGALDNASGCAALINLARALSHLNPRPRRSILFAAVTAEESGLLGSKYYARHPSWPRRKIVANYNIDGINIWGSTRDIGMVGYGKNSLSQLVSGVARRRGRICVPDPDVDKGLFYRSDHFSFASIGVPSAYFKAGNAFYKNASGRRRIKLAYTGTRYHTQLDEMGKGWNLEGAKEDTRLILECLTRTANDPIAPTWTPGDEFERLR